jgi:hypothetical protein
MRKPFAFLLPLLAAMFLLNADALHREADLLPFDHPVRAAALRILAPVRRLTGALFLDRPRAVAEAVEAALVGRGE